MFHPFNTSRQNYLFIIFILSLLLPAAVSAQEKIAFTSHRDGNAEIYVMNADGSNPTRLTFFSASDGQPSFSGGGSKIAFESYRNGNAEIYVMYSNGFDQTRLTNNAAADTDPSFSPDGSKIAFVSDRDGNSEIYVMNSDGTNQTRLTNDSLGDDQPSFSFDGTKITFFRDAEVWIMNADGSNQTRLTFSPGLDVDPAFSPDGSKIVFWSTRDPNEEIYVMNVDGTNPVRLTINTASDIDPVFSPDGTHIAFATTRDGNNEIYVMNAQGGSPQRLTFNTTLDNQPSWSDGSLFPPQLSNVSLTPAQIVEGETVTLSGNISSPNVGTTLTVNWSDGSPQQVFNYPAGTTAFSETHQYLENRFEVYGVTVTLSNLNGTDSQLAVVQVVNDPPNVSLFFVPPTLIGTPVTLQGLVTDLGVLDAQTVNINWGDGSSNTIIALAAGVTAFSSNHGYAAPGAYTVTVTATDDDGGNSDPASQLVGIVPAPTSGKIAFTSNFIGNNNIWLMNSNGTGPVMLTTNPASDAYPNLSRDGSKIAFVSDRDGNQEIYSMNAAGAFQTRLTNNAAQDNSPVYSPDGTKIAFASNRDGNYEIYIMNANGTGQTRLTTNTLDEGQIAFSPDGTKILFARLAANQSDSHIYSMNLDGSSQTPLTTGSFVLNGQPNVSPDGTTIVFSSVRPFSGHTDPEIYVMNANGTGQTRLTTAGGQDLEPVFSPNGSKIAFRSERTGNAEIFIMDSNGANQQRITFGSTALISFAPSWANVSVISVDIPDNLAAEQGATLTVPIIVSDTTGKGVLAYDFALNFDPAVLQPQPIALDKAGTLSAGFEVNAGTGTPGRVVISGFGSTALSGAGTLLNLKFNVIGIAPTTSLLTLSPFTFNEGIPFADVFAGQVFVQGTIRGTVLYGTSATPIGVQNVMLSGVGSPNVSATSAADGTYRLAGFGNGAYTVTPSKSDQVNGITAFDASLISQFLVGTGQLSTNQRIAAEVSGNGTISSFDAALIAQYVVGLPNPGNAGAWIFAPSSRSYATVGSLTGEDYSAILIGEVSGNWNASGAAALYSLTNASPGGDERNASQAERKGGPKANPAVSIGQLRVAPGEAFAVPVNLTYPAGTAALRAYQFDVSYDPNVIVTDGTGVDGTNTLSSGFAVVSNSSVPGRLRIAVFGAGSIVGSGTLLNLRFKAVGARNSTSPLTVGGLLLNEGSPVGTASSGSVSVKR
jgi:Tol biopolymer transport system component